jgi:hypothetical protein
MAHMSEQEADGKIGRGTMAFVAACFAFLAIVVVVLTVTDEPEPDEGTGVGAQAVCQEFVEDKLKSPSSADFTSTDSAFTVDDKVWTANGVVDSENSFGAKIRNSYECEVEYAGDENWNLVSINVGTN